jgi:hypothetical protein
MPPAHTRPAPQATPQPPQWLLSTAVSRHTPEHAVWPVGHESTQAPAVQICPPGHDVPHAPQLDGSMRVSAQRADAPLPQRVSGAAQSSTHAPAEHTLPGGQLTPQPPQLSRSDAVETQRVPQAVWPAGHERRHVPEPQS